MDGSEGPAAPKSGNDNYLPPHPEPLPPGEEEEMDPEIEALLEFEPVPRKVKRPDGWTPELQRIFIRLLAELGTPQRAAAAMKKKVSGIETVYGDDEVGEFRAAWDRAVELAADRELARARVGMSAGIAEPPHRRRRASLAGQDYDDDDEPSLHARAEEARDSISAKLLRCRRLYLQEISGCPGKRAAFEILTHYPIDWDRAARCEAQDDEPWRSPNMREPEMLLTAENGWIGDMVHGPDKQAELREALDRHRAERGLKQVEWDGGEAVTE
jgi:hypothetical protein